MSFLRRVQGLVAAGLIVLAGGCATGPQWEQTSGSAQVNRQAGYSVNLPAGWFWMQEDSSAPMTATHDGPDLQAIRVIHREHATAFPHIGRSSSADMAPRELAELFVAEIRKEHGLGSLVVLENAPSDFGGTSGFRLKVEWRDAGAVRYHGLVYGCARPQGLYVIDYHAPVLHYFAASEPFFEEVVRSFRFVS